MVITVGASGAKEALVSPALQVLDDDRAPVGLQGSGQPSGPSTLVARWSSRVRTPSIRVSTFCLRLWASTLPPPRRCRVCHERADELERVGPTTLSLSTVATISASQRLSPV